MTKTYRVTPRGRLRAAILLLTLVIISGFSARKALGLWQGVSSKPSDLVFLNLDFNTTVPALILSLLALSSLLVVWFLVVEMVTQVTLSENGLLIRAPGFRLFYPWKEIAALEVLTGPAEDCPVVLQVGTNPKLTPILEAGPGEDKPEIKDDIAFFLSEADLREDKNARRKAREERRLKEMELRSRITRPDGRKTSVWFRFIYPQVNRPDRLLFYPALEERNLLLAEIEEYLAKVEE